MSKWDLVRDFFKAGRGNVNKFNEAFFFGSNKYTNNDDRDLKKYIDLAYNINPDVYSIVSQISSKVISVPYGVKKVNNLKPHNKLNKLLKSNKYDLNYIQRLKAHELEKKALTMDEYGMPIEKPNNNQTWDEFFKLSDIFLSLTGNVYWYLVSPELGINKGEPKEIYVLPSHLIEIVLKENAKFLSNESVIASYMLIEGASYIEFDSEDVVHISIDNPNFGFNGEHLYGQSQLRAAWKDIEASNKGLNLNINTLKNGGVFGFIHGKGTPLGDTQAKAIKSRLKEMNNDQSDLARIAGISTEIGFTRLSLTTDELKPFEYLKFNQKQICNTLGWSTALLNQEDTGKHDRQTEERKRVVTDTVVPRIKLYENSFNEGIMSRFKNQKGNIFKFDIKEIPELQADLAALSKWIGEQVDRGIFSRNTALTLLGMETNSDPNMDIITVKDDVMALSDAILPTDDIKISNRD